MYTQLLVGETVQRRLSGHSMEPLIKHRALVTIEPVDPDKVHAGDIVHVKVKGRWYTHKVIAVTKDQVLIGNNKGHLNGWTNRRNIAGIVTKVE